MHQSPTAYYSHRYERCMVMCVLMFVLLLFSGMSNAQRIRFTDTTNIWGVSFYNGHVSPNPTLVKSSFIDSVLVRDSFTYRLLENAWVREGTLTGKVYAKSAGDPFLGSTHTSIYDTAEFVLYDYKLNVGDSLAMPITYYGGQDSFSVHVLKEIDSMWINNTWHRVQYFQFSRGFYPYSDYKVIEGIGSEMGPLNPTPSYNHEVSFRLACFEHKGGLAMLNDSVALYRSCEAVIGIEEFEREIESFQLYPNGATTEVVIDYTSHQYNDYRVYIYDFMGREVYHVPW